MFTKLAHGSYMILTAPPTGQQWVPRLQIPDAHYEEMPSLRDMDRFVDIKALNVDFNEPLTRTVKSLHKIIVEFCLALRSSPQLCSRWNAALADASRTVDLGFLAGPCEAVDRLIVDAKPDDPAAIVNFALRLRGAGLFSVIGESFPLIASGFGNIMGRVVLIGALVAMNHAIDGGVFYVFLEHFVISHEMELESGIKPPTGLERRFRMRYEPGELFGSTNPEDLGGSITQFTGQLNQPEGILEAIARGRDIARMEITRVTDKRHPSPSNETPWPERLSPFSTNYRRLQEIVSALI